MSDSTPTDNTPVCAFDLSPGLIEFYSAQAELMLAQYENINRLLGPTSHGTPSGDLCENLLRQFLRHFLPPTLSVDKGYFYGRSLFDGKDSHCPEIDILVHDSSRFTPLSRTGDFVIVRPQAVRAMMQVKRTFAKKAVREGLQNIVQAKQQLVDVLWENQNRATPKWTGSLMPPSVFTALIGFDGQLGRDLKAYEELLLASHLRQRSYQRQKMIETSMYVLPNLSALFVAFSFCWMAHATSTINVTLLMIPSLLPNFQERERGPNTREKTRRTFARRPYWQRCTALLVRGKCHRLHSRQASIHFVSSGYSSSQLIGMSQTMALRSDVMTGGLRRMSEEIFNQPRTNSTSR